MRQQAADEEYAGVGSRMRRRSVFLTARSTRSSPAAAPTPSTSSSTTLRGTVAVAQPLDPCAAEEGENVPHPRGALAWHRDVRSAVGVAAAVSTAASLKVHP